MTNQKSIFKRATMLLLLVVFAVSVAGCWPFYIYESDRATANDNHSTATPQVEMNTRGVDTPLVAETLV